MYEIYEHKVWEILAKDGSLQDYFGLESNDVQRWVVQTAFNLGMRFNDEKLRIYGTYDEMETITTSREEFESFASKHPDHEALILVHNGFDITDIVWENLEPKAPPVDLDVIKNNFRQRLQEIQAEVQNDIAEDVSNIKKDMGL